MKEMKVLLTGGCGFIGSHIVEHFNTLINWEIHVIDSLTYAGDVARVQDFKCKIHWHDLRAPLGEDLIKRIGEVDYIIHAAADSHVDKGIVNPRDFIHNNVMSTITMLEYARVMKPSKFIFVSTDESFGPAKDDYFHKEWDTHLPSNPYSASKAASEDICIAYWRTYKVPVIITCTMNNLGPRQHSEKFVPHCILNLLAGIETSVHATLVNGVWKSGSRTWLHAKNHADALLWLLQNHTPEMYGKEDRPSKFNIAGDKELGNIDVLLKIAKILKVEPLFHFTDWHSSRPGHDSRYALDGSKLRKLGWKPLIDLEQSFIETVKWYANQRTKTKKDDD